MRILHLGFEDHRRPGSGGGSFRNHEINRRLAAHHQVTVVTAAFPGARDRTEDGVTYRHVGIGHGYTPSLLSYFAALPAVVRSAAHCRAADLVVEEFAPPMSSLGVAGWSGLPTCANVQWLFARQKAAEYRLPVAALVGTERWAVRRHRSFIALTHELADQLTALQPAARIVVNGMGVDPAPGGAGEPTEGNSLFLGRLDVRQKGIDLLLEAFARIPAGRRGTLTIAGDGRGEDRVRSLVDDFGLRDDVTFAGRVGGAEKWDLLARAQVVVMPSRWETFGLVALEAFAATRPVVAFDIPCLREVVTPDRGRLVPPDDIDAFAAAWLALLSDPACCRALGLAGARYAETMRWADVADRQARAYAEVLDG